MPLKAGKSKAVISYNKEELIKKYLRDGHIGEIYPRSLEHAKRIAWAIAYDKAGRYRKRRKKKGVRRAKK